MVSQAANSLGMALKYTPVPTASILKAECLKAVASLPALREHASTTVIFVIVIDLHTACKIPDVCLNFAVVLLT